MPQKYIEPEKQWFWIILVLSCLLILFGFLIFLEIVSINTGKVSTTTKMIQFAVFAVIGTTIIYGVGRINTSWEKYYDFVEFDTIPF